MNEDRLRYADFVDLLTTGPTGEPRAWAGRLILRMLESNGNCRYRGGGRLAGEANAEAALASLRAAAAALSGPEQGLLVSAALLMPWGQLRRDTGLTLAVPGILAAFRQDLGPSPCLAATRAVIERAEDAVRRYPIQGLLPEVRQPGQGLVLVFGMHERRRFKLPASEIEIDRLTVAVQSFKGWGWEANLRPLVVCWLGALTGSEAEVAVRRLLVDLPAAAGNLHARWRSLGLLDWLAAHPGHPKAAAAMAAGTETARADVRKAAVDLAAALERWEVLEDLARNDPDRAVRQRAEKRLSSRNRGACTLGRQASEPGFSSR